MTQRSRQPRPRFPCSLAPALARGPCSRPTPLGRPTGAVTQNRRQPLTGSEVSSPGDSGTFPGKCSLKCHRRALSRGQLCDRLPRSPSLLAPPPRLLRGPRSVSECRRPRTARRPPSRPRGPRPREPLCRHNVVPSPQEDRRGLETETPHVRPGHAEAGPGGTGQHKPEGRAGQTVAAHPPGLWAQGARQGPPQQVWPRLVPAQDSRGAHTAGLRTPRRSGAGSAGRATRTSRGTTSLGLSTRNPTGGSLNLAHGKPRGSELPPRPGSLPGLTKPPGNKTPCV